MDFYVIGDRETVLGLRLAGVEGCVAGDRDSALAALRNSMTRKNTGVVLVTEQLAAQMREEVDAHVFGAGTPLLLEIPGAEGASPSRPAIGDIVRKATGISL